MKAIQRIIYTGFAAVAIASAAMPVFPAQTPAARDATWSAGDCAEPAAIQDVGRDTPLAQACPRARELDTRR